MSATSRSGNPSVGSSELLNSQVERPVKRMTLDIPRELHVKLKRAAADEDRYIREIVMDAIRDYLKEKGHNH